MSSSGASSTRSDKVDPVLRNAIRYTVSAREYELLHQYLISRAPVVRKRTPPPPNYEATVKDKDDYNAAAIRASVRVFIASYVGSKGWELFTTKILRRTQSQQTSSRAIKSPHVRLSGSLALILLFHRLLHRFFIRLRAQVLSDEARPFRRRNPRVAKTLTSRLAPAVGASLAGFFLAVYPADQLRVTIAIYVFTRALEFAYNGLENKGHFQNRPWWFGSWLLMPAACGQLLHAFVFDRDCFPEAYGKFILKNSPRYIQTRPEGYAAAAPWPGTFEIVDSLGTMSKLKWPAFVSPILFPKAQTLPRSLTRIAPITSPAHPAIKPLSCALLHPNDPSCLRTYITYYIQAFPAVTRFFTIIFTALSVLRYKTFISAPVPFLNALAARILRMSLFITGAIGTSWGSICFFQHALPRGFLPTQRFFLGGALGGLWAFLERRGGRGNFLYSARLSLDSAWKVGVKRGWWKGVKNGDVLLLVASLALVNATYEVDPKAVSGGVVRKGLGMLRGDGWVDRAVEREGVVEEKEEK
ncbi:hypothetical protein EJ05DRAFT_535913 [Pseudovirgaria hyperparasitica]|uniref:Transmembrane protein 135 N-terminal domain-containing protein n=1 Tax=Pseudovirgaria hyperparasitica TaxID=470096 RepID=A0A6A6WEU0_9PEZI|nr:uncharacterized protein EJ05DRAFT_535913 [Pseudovirgaria hyperparasitica]KAF2761055.1 hypothetical protein EJ05DRAFT_535913 [Pseudovirgaria hyperparasitica]